jgi:hypothetical protein
MRDRADISVAASLARLILGASFRNAWSRMATLCGNRDYLCLSDSAHGLLNNWLRQFPQHADKDVRQAPLLYISDDCRSEQRAVAAIIASRDLDGSDWLIEGCRKDIFRVARHAAFSAGYPPH